MRIAGYGAALIAAGMLAMPAAASVVVLGNSVGFQCFDAARTRNGSTNALNGCTEALRSGMLTPHDEVATYVNRGIVRVYQQDYDDALVDFDRAIALDPDQAESYLNKGSTLLRMGGDPRQAIALLSEALERETERPELAYYSRAIAHEVAGDVQQAYHDYRRAQAAAPDWKDPARELTRFQVRPASSNF